VALKDAHWSVRKCAVDALARIKDPCAVLPLTHLLKDPDHDVREAAVEALAKIRDKSAIEKLVVSLADAQSTVRHAAGAALTKIDSDWKLSESARRAIPALKALQADRDYWVRHTAAEVIQRITNAKKTDDPAPTPATEIMRRRQTAGIEAIIDALSDWDRDVRQAAAEALGRISDSRAAQALARALEDTDRWVRQAATN
jgi:HEAT repeat protein